MVGKTSCHFCAAILGPIAFMKACRKKGTKYRCSRMLRWISSASFWRSAGFTDCSYWANFASSSCTQRRSRELNPPHLKKASYQFDQVPPMRVALKIICTPGHSFSPPLELLQEHPALHDLEFGTNANLPQLCHDALPTRVVGRGRREPVHREAVRISCFFQEL